MDLSLLPDFITETIEHLDEMETNLLQLEKQAGDREALDNVFRTAHSIKGNAEYLGIEKVSSLSHSLENLLEILRKNPEKLQREIIDILFRVKDRLDKLVDELSKDKIETQSIDDLLNDLDKYSSDNFDTKGLIKLKTNDNIITEDSIDLQVKNTSDKELAEELKSLLIETARSDINEDSRLRMIEILCELLAQPELKTNRSHIFEKLKDQAENLLFSDDAGDMLAVLNKLLGEQVKETCLADKLTNSDNDTYADEADEELFVIYIEHLKENLLLMNTLVEEFKTADSYSKLFEKCIETLDSLKSSANYMDYRKIVRIYEKWNAEIEGYSENLFIADDEEFKVFIENGMSDYCSSIIRFFPQCSEELSDITNTLHTSMPETDTKSLVEENTGRTDEPVIENFDSTHSDMSALPDELHDNSGLFDELDSMFTAPGNETSGEYDAENEPYLKGLEEELAGLGTNYGSDDKDERELYNSTKPEHILPETEELKTDQPSDIKDVNWNSPKNKTESEVSFNADVEVHDVETSNTTDPEQLNVPVEQGALPEITARSTAADRIVTQSIRVDSRKIDSLMNQAGELVVSRAGFAQLFNEMQIFQHEMQDSGNMDSKDLKSFKDLIFKFNDSILSLGRVANELQDGVMKVRMLPISQLFNRYPRLVRDLVHETEKEVRLDISGEETELDKMVIEAIADPLVHIIRNAIDHGAETVKQRRVSGKPETCVLKLDSYHESNHVVIEVLDDGSGIDPDKIKAVAIKNLSMTPEELNRMTKREITGLITLPGFSTSAEVTRTSGRGVGMDVVKKNIEKLNGTIDIDSIKGQGTRIRIKIPLTLAIIKALLVKVGDETFTIPLTTVEETLQIQENELSTIEGVEVVKLRNSVLPLLRLSELFNIKSKTANDQSLYIVVVNTGSRQMGLVVDELIGQEETVIKPLVDYLQENSGFSGATILGDGGISLILDIYELVNLSMLSMADRNKLKLISNASRPETISDRQKKEGIRARTLH